MFEAAFREAQASLPAGGVAGWEAGFRSVGGDGRVSLVKLVVFPDRMAPRFRMGG